MLQDKIKEFHAYLKRLFTPFYLFPFKLIFQLIRFIFLFILNFIFSFFALIFDLIAYPFRSFRHFWIALGSLILLSLLTFSLIFNLTYIYDTMGLESIGCYFTMQSKDGPKSKVVRIVGDNSEGSGFFITPQTIVTNFHVIQGEPSPKIIFPNGRFNTPDSMKHSPNLDLAMLTTAEPHPELVIPLSYQTLKPGDETPLFAYGYPMGTDILGEASVARGHFIANRTYSDGSSSLIQTDINLVEGMSGGPLTNFCGKVVGINTLGMAGLSMFIPTFELNQSFAYFTDDKIAKLEFHPEVSPEKAVEAFYNYLKIRRMTDAYDLLANSYQANATYDEWFARFTPIISVDVVKTELVNGAVNKNTVFVKFITRNWVNNAPSVHYYEGTWVTKLEDGLHRLSRSMIKEVVDPPSDWPYTGPEF